MERRNNGPGVAFLVAAALTYDIFSSTNSSPQTTEINARHRASTLMKWVNIGAVQAIVFIILAAIGDAVNRAAILMGGTLALVSMYGQYVYAKACGLASDEKGTEQGFGEYWGNKRRQYR